MTCRTYRPDHNGECLNCDEDADAHWPIRRDCITQLSVVTGYDEAAKLVDGAILEGLTTTLNARIASVRASNRALVIAIAALGFSVGALVAALTGWWR